MTDFVTIVTIVLVSILSEITCKDEDFIKCPLVWRTAVVEETLPAFSVSTTVNGEDHYVARINDTIGGRFSASLRKSYFITPSNIAESSIYFDVLTNPHDCIINWIAGENKGIHAVQIASGSGAYVGRSMEDGYQLSGVVSSGSLKLVNSLGQIVSKSNNFQTLQSYSKGLNMEMTQFSFDTSPVSGKRDFMGVDQIINQGPGMVKQTVTHRKRVKESTTLSTTSTWGHAFEAKIYVQPEFNLIEHVLPDGDTGMVDNLTVSVGSPTLTLGYKLNYAKEKNEELHKYTETEYEVVREVTVPPFTSLQVCSSVTISDDFSVSYLARARYSAPGLTAQEVADILKKDGKSGEALGDSVITEETGRFKGTLALATQFIVADITDPAGCAAMVN